MRRAAVVLAVAASLALVGASLVPATAQVPTEGQSARSGAAVVAQEDHHSPWLVEGTGGKVNNGREDDDEQQYPGKTTFLIDDHAPGATGNSFNIFAEGFSENIRMHWNVVRMSDFRWDGCTSTDAGAFGIDRGNDDPGTETDQSLLDAYKSVNYTADGIFVEFYKKERLAGGPVNITVNDQIVSRVRDCLENPDEAGWYRLVGYINGSTKMDATTMYTIYGAARYVPICEGCSNRSTAEEKLGPPPTTCPSANTFSQDSKEWTCRTEDGEYYTSSDPPGASGDSTATSTSTATGTPTPTATSAPDDGDEGTGDQQRSGSTSTRTEAADERRNSGDDRRTTTARRTRTAEDRRGGGRTRTATPVPSTPTLAEGPGLTAALALATLLAAAVLAVRRG